MKLRFLYVLTATLFAAVQLNAKDFPKTEIATGLDYDMTFDNRELYRSKFSESMTIFGSRLTPTIGLTLQNNDDARHSIMFGVDLLRDFGAADNKPKNIIKEPVFYYRLEKKTGNMDIEMYTGVFPRKKMEGEYSEAFFSDSLKFYDNNLEGLLLKFRLQNSYFELGCDWMGQQGPAQRERFMVFSSGEGKIAPVFSLGYSAYMYHYAGSEAVRGVVDNILINPYAVLDLSSKTDFQTFTMRLGWLQGLQNDRKNIGQYTRPYGAEFDFELRKWNIGMRNSMFYGRDMMPYYNRTDAGGFKYGNDLYFGDPFYRVHDDSSEGLGMYDRFELYWNPFVSKHLDIKVRALFHFNGSRYSGCQQVVTVNFKL